jgi:hypothetical protein
MKDDLIHILREVENPNGTIDMEIEVTDEFMDRYKEITGKKRATRKGIQEFLLKVIEDATANEP